MDRRKFLVRAAAATSVLGLAQGLALSGTPSKVFRLAGTNNSASQTGAGAFAFAAEVATLSGGRLRVDVYPGGTAGGELETIQDTARNALELVIVSSAGYASIAPKLGVFDIPFLFRDVRHARAVLDGPIGKAALAQMEPAGLVGLGWGENGLRHLTTATVPVTSPKDLAGLKIRVPQSEAMLTGFKALGANAQPLPFPDLYGALSSGDFQAQENPLANILGSGFFRVQKYLCLTGHAYSAAMLVMSRAAYDGLSGDERAVLHKAARAAVQASRDTGDASDANAVAELERRGMTVLTDIDRSAFVAASLAAQGQFEAQFGKATLDAIRAHGA